MAAYHGVRMLLPGADPRNDGAMMLASLVNSLLGRFGMRLVRNSRVRPRTGRFQDLPEVRTLIGRIARDPADAAAHADYATLALQHGNGFLAHAQARNAEWLAPTATNSGCVRIAAQTLPPLSGLGHNAYHRLQALARILREEGLGPTSTVLDVGGGDGELAAFLSPASYFLADPVANGIAATDLPASIGPFDYVVSCHVLEHVEPAARSAFLDALIERAGDAVVLLNPFHLDAAGEQSLDQAVGGGRQRRLRDQPRRTGRAAPAQLLDQRPRARPLCSR